MEAGGQDVEQEAAHELLGSEGHGLVARAALGPVVLPAERDADVRVASRNFLTLCIMQILTIQSLLAGLNAAQSDGAAVRSSDPTSAVVMTITGLTADIFGKPFHFADQPLHCVAAPDLEPALQRAQMPHVVAIGISGLEGGQELPRSLIGVGFQALEHFRPARFKR